MRKEFYSTILLIVITLLLGVGFFSYKKVQQNRILGVKSISSQQLEKKIKGKTETVLNPSSLFFNDEIVAYDAIDDRVFVSQNLEKENWYGNLSSNDGKLFILNDEKACNKKELISEGRELDLICVRDDSYSKTKLVISGMPIMTLSAWHDVGKEAWGGAIQLFDPSQSGNEYQTGVCNFSVRGNIARLYDKKSYKLTLSDEKMSLCGLREDDDWTLNGLYDDIGLIRNKLSYQLWNELSATNNVDGDNTVETAFVELIVDNEYRGVYLLCDRIDAKKIGLNEGDFLYKQKDWDNKRENLSEAFIVSYPNEADESDKEIMTNFMDMLYYPEDYKLDFTQLTEDIYIDNAVDYYLYCMYLAAGDNLFENSYIVARKGLSDTYKFFEIPWDMNATYGNVRVLYSADRIEKIDGFISTVGKLLMKADEREFEKLSQRRWNELRETVLSNENVKELANEYIDYTEKTGAYNRNLAKWPTYHVNNSDTYRDMSELWNKQDLFDFIEKRGTFLDNYFQKGQ